MDVVVKPEIDEPIERAADGEHTEGSCRVDRGMFHRKLWKDTADYFGGSEKKMDHEIVNGLMFLDELDETETILDNQLFTHDLVQSVFIPNDVSPELITKFIDFAEEKGSGILSFRMEYNRYCSVEALERILLNCKNLVRVRLIGFTEIDNARILENITKLQYLSDLEISGCKNIDNKLLFKLQKGLISLNLANSNFDGECLVAFPFLGRLNISGCDFAMKNNVILPLMRHCLQIRELSMANMKCFTLDDFYLVIASQGSLKKLDFSHNTNIIPVLARCSKNFFCLKSLNIAFCGADMKLGSLYELFATIDELFISGSKLERNLKEDKGAKFPNLKIVNLHEDIVTSAPRQIPPQPTIRKAHTGPEQVKSNDRVRNARHRNKERKKAQKESQKRETIISSANDSDFEDCDYCY